jgi:hypothetical protein
VIAVKYRALDKVTWVYFDPEACSHEWTIVEPPTSHRDWPPDHPDGLFLHKIYRTADGHWVEHKSIYDLERQVYDKDPVYDIVEEITEQEARRVLAEIGATSPEDDPPIVCSQATLSKILGTTPHRAHLLKTLKERGYVKDYKPFPGNKHLWMIWLTDPREHKRILEEVRGLQADRRRKNVAGT